MINLSVQTGKYPTKLKIAKIISMSNEDDKTEPGNYRPISLLSQQLSTYIIALDF